MSLVLFVIDLVGSNLPVGTQILDQVNKEVFLINASF